MCIIAVASGCCAGMFYFIRSVENKRIAVERILGLGGEVLNDKGQDHTEWSREDYVQEWTSYNSIEFVGLQGCRDDTKLEDCLSHVKALPRVKSLWLMGRQLDEPCIDRIAELSRLEELSLGNADLPPRMVPLRRLRHLRSLSLSYQNDITPSLISDIAQIRSLQELDLSWSSVSDACFSQPIQFPKLRELWVAHSDVTLEGLLALDAPCLNLVVIHPGQIPDRQRLRDGIEVKIHE